MLTLKEYRNKIKDSFGESTLGLFDAFVQSKKDSPRDIYYEFRNILESDIPIHKMENKMKWCKHPFAQEQDFMMVFDINDSSYGAVLYEGGNAWCEMYNEELRRIVERMESEENGYVEMYNLVMIEQDKARLKSYTDLDFIKNFLIKQWFASHIKESEIDNSFAKVVEDAHYFIDTVVKNDFNPWFIGTTKEVMTALKNTDNNEYGIKDKDNPTSLHDICSSFETIVIQVKDGLATCLLR